MQNTKTFLFGSKGAHEVKGVSNFANDEYFTDALVSAGDELRSYFRSVPWLWRGIRYRCNGVANMPFEIRDARGDVVDKSGDWQNVLEYMPNPKRLLRQVTESLVLMNCAYVLKETNPSGYVKDLRYLNPLTITPVIDERLGLVGFKRSIKSMRVNFAPEEMLYFWGEDAYTEIGPPAGSDAKAALAAAGALFNVEQFVSAFFMRGAIKATIISVPAGTAEAERSRIEEWFNNVMTGIRNAFRSKVFNADLVKPTIIGEGLENLQDDALTRSMREDISTALGVPQYKLFTDAANRATAEQADIEWLRDTVIPDCTAIAEVLNEQLLEPEYHWEFLPESLEAFQEDEVNRAGALSQLVGAFSSASTPEQLRLAMEILGYDLTDEQWAVLEEEPEPEIAPVGESVLPMPGVTPPQLAPFAEATQEQAASPQEIRSALFNWKRAVLASLKTGHGAAVDFDNPCLPQSVCDFLRYELDGATDPAAVDVLFKAAREMAIEPDPLVKLTSELKRANDLLERTHE